MSLDSLRRKKMEGLVRRRVLLEEAGIVRALRSIAQKIVEQNQDLSRVILLGIRTAGAHLAKRLQVLIRDEKQCEVAVGAVDITLYRDDVFTGLPRPDVGPTELPGPVHGTRVILVDDVLFTGRTIRAAMEELIEFGRPERVQLAVLVDRGHRELPIQPDYVGLRVETTREQSVRVMLRELGETDEVVLCEKSSP